VVLWCNVSILNPSNALSNWDSRKIFRIQSIDPPPYFFVKNKIYRIEIMDFSKKMIWSFKNSKIVLSNTKTSFLMPMKSFLNRKSMIQESEFPLVRLLSFSRKRILLLTSSKMSRWIQSKRRLKRNSTTKLSK